MVDKLIQLGLSRSEAEVLCHLLEIGPCFAGSLVYKTKKHRQIVYNALERLQRLNLVVCSKKNGKNFYALGDPQQLLIDIKQKEVIASELGKKFASQNNKAKEYVDVFSGPNSYEKGLESFRIHAELAKEYIVIGGEPREWYLSAETFFSRHVDEVRKLKTRGIMIQILFYESERNSAIEFIGPYVNDPYICKIANDKYRPAHTTWLCGDNVYILTPTAEPLVIHIRSKSLAMEFRNLFHKQWKEATLLKLKKY